MRNLLILSTFFLSIVYSPCVLAEGDAATRVTDRSTINVDPTDADNAQAQSQGSSTFADPNTIRRDQSVAPIDGSAGSADRAAKARNAKSQGTSGTAAATVAAAGLAAQSGAAFAGGLYGLGAALAAMSALETAQAIATANTASDNDGQDKLLTTNESINGVDSGAKGSSKSGSSINLPKEVENAIQRQGVNVDNFKDQLASGAFTRVDDVLNAMGYGGKVSEYDLKQAERAADKTIRETNNETQNNTTGRESITGNESAGGIATGSSLGRGVNSANASEQNAAKGSLVIESLSQVDKSRSHELTKEINMATGGTMSDFLKKFSGDNKQGLLERKLTEYEMQLEKANVFPATGKGQIFQIAHRNYREFGKWRRNTKLAIR